MVQDWFAGGMSDENPRTEDLPEDEHLRSDVVPAAQGEQEDFPDKDFTPGLTNAGQQVGGLAPAVGHGDKQEPDGTDSNNPI